MELFCILITLAIFSSYYRLLMTQRSESVLYRFLSASVLSCGQIILSELFLGLFHQLYLSFLVVVNLSIAVLVLVLARRSVSGGPRSLRDDVARMKQSARSALDGPAAVLGLLAAITYGWILVAAYYLPPRGVDDIAYHLPAIFEYVQSHEIRLLPVSMPPFAYPENAELLFMWPVLFAHDQRMVDGVNVPFVLLSVLTVYALLRHFSLPKNDSLFAALLYALCPVVLMQAGVNYVDIIVSLFLLLSLYYVLLYHERQRPLDLYLAGLSVGLMCGMKYTAPFLALPLHLLIIPAMLKGKWRHAIGYASIIVLAGGWWYIRNAYVLGEPLYPMNLQASVSDGLVNVKGGSILQNIRYNLPYWIARYPLMDSGVGRYDGGFGLAFWGMCFSSWIYVTFRSIFTFRRADVSRLIVLAYIPAGFLLLLAFPPRVVDFNGRLAMFVVPIGLFAFCEVLRIMHDKVYTTIIKGICIALSMLTVSLLFVSVQPIYGLSGVISDRRNHIKPSEFKYLADSIELHAVLRPAWELLDLLTRDDPTGLSCFIASDFPLFSPAPVYGSRLQNRVLNLSKDERGSVDAYVCTYLNKNMLDRPVPVHDGGRPGETTIQDIMTKDDYVAVLQTDHACLMLHRAVFDRPEMQRILQAYYRDTWPEAVALAEEMDSQLNANIPIVTSSEIGYGVRSLDMSRARSNRVFLTFDNRVGEVAARMNVKQCYTLEGPLPGYRSRKVLRVIYQHKGIDIYLNRRS